MELNLNTKPVQGAQTYTKLNLLKRMKLNLSFPPALLDFAEVVVELHYLFAVSRRHLHTLATH